MYIAFLGTTLLVYTEKKIGLLHIFTSEIIGEAKVVNEPSFGVIQT